MQCKLKAGRTSLAVALLLAALSPGIVGATETRPADAAGSETSPDAEQTEILIDEEGRRYRAVEYPKGKEGVDFVRTADGQVKIRFGVPFEVLSESETSFILKVIIAPKPSLPAHQLPELPEPIHPETPLWPTVDRLNFEPYDEGLPRQGQWRDGFDLADMNGDGRTDVVFGPARKGAPQPNIFLQKEGGSWQRWRTRLPPMPYDYGDAAAADFNRDGYMDLALAVHLRGALVLVGDGEGTFTPWTEGIALNSPGRVGGADAFTSRAVETLDWDGDGWVDMVLLGEGPAALERPGTTGGVPADSRGLVLYRNRGDGSWERRQGGSRTFGASLAVSDFDNDGAPDVLTGSNVQGLDMLLNLHSENRTWTAVRLPGVGAHGFAFAVAAADLDRDGRMDALVGGIERVGSSQRTGVAAYFNRADGGWRRVDLFSVAGRTAIYGLTTGDVDGDGRTDVAFGTGDGKLQVLLGRGDRTFAIEDSPEIQQDRGGCRSYGLRLADLDGDGGDELLASFAGEAARLELIYTIPGCPDGGSIKVWRPRAKE